jgi:hypothetical protein
MLYEALSKLPQEPNTGCWDNVLVKVTVTLIVLMKSNSRVCCEEIIKEAVCKKI